MRHLVYRATGVLAAALLALAIGTCGGGNSGTGSPGVPTVPVTPPAPTPTPGPTPDPPLSGSCAKLPPGDPSASCQKEPPDFEQDVEEAIQTLQAQEPSIFDGDVVISVGAYYVGLIRILDGKGLCAASDGEELGVARTSGYNEQYDILTSRNQVRHAPTSYRTTCFPSAVPPAQAPLPPNQAGCPLPSSREVACSRELAGRYYNDVQAAVDQIQKDKPELFDFTDTAPATNNPRLKDLNAYLEGVVEILRQKGYCAITGEEIGVKKDTNDFNEQYDIELSGQYVRSGPGMYRSSCYPAAF
jgi:hypothetical protein